MYRWLTIHSKAARVRWAEAKWMLLMRVVKFIRNLKHRVKVMRKWKFALNVFRVHRILVVRPRRKHDAASKVQFFALNSQ